MAKQKRSTRVDLFHLYPDVDDFSISPAALVAALNGDFANAIIASTPGGIKAQEAQGQREMIAKCRLPINARGVKLTELEITLHEVVDDLFVSATLPEGWKIKPTDHSMWSELIDAKGSVRASIFYKAAFYDRDAFMNVHCRYNIERTYDEERCIKVIDNQEKSVLFTSQTIKESEFPDRKKFYERLDELEQEAEAHLNEKYPDHKNPLAYWS